MNKPEKKFDETNGVSDLLDEKYEIFSSQIRLTIMLILHSYQKVKISELQKVFQVSSGKLEHHLNALESDGLIIKRVDLFVKRALTTVEITDKGQRLLLEYLDKMKDILDKMNIT